MKLGRLEVVYIAPVNRSQRRFNINCSKLFVALAGMLTFAMTQINTFAYSDQLKKPLPKIAEAEEIVLDYGFAVGRLVCVIMAIFEIVKAIKDGDTNAFWGIIIKYALALCSLKMLPWVFDMIAGFFS